MLMESILDEPVPGVELQDLLAPVGFADWVAAGRTLQHMAHLGNPSQREKTIHALSACLPHLLIKLNSAAGPDQVLVSLERLASKMPDPAELFTYLSDNPRTADILVTLFSSSQFLTEILLRNPDYFELLTAQARLAQLKTSDQYYEAALEALYGCSELSQQLDILRRYQRWELLRIGLWDLLDQFDLTTTTGQLSNLADGLVRACLNLVTRHLLANESIEALPSCPVGFAVIAMGKLGGRELNYSSDIDLLFITGADEPLYRRVGQKLIEALSAVTGEGFLYRVDMRLRPWGTAGALVTTVDGYMAYLSKSARLWEKQALLKARWIAGDRDTGSDFLNRSSAFLFEANPETIRAEVFAMKQRTESYLRQQGRIWGEVKLGEGSIRDIEFIVQYLQLAYGGKQPEVRNRNTLEGIRRLTRYGLLSLEESRALSEGYVFLRTIEHHLQMMHYRQTQTLPEDPAGLASLSRRLGFQGVIASDNSAGDYAGEQFLLRYQQHSATIRSIYLKYIGNPPMEEPDVPAAAQPEVRRHIERMHPSYESSFSHQDIARHASLAGQLDRDHLVEVEATDLEDGRWRVSIIAYDYPGELALICGLMFVYGMDIYDGDVFTYEPESNSPSGKTTPRKIVDVFTVRPADGDLPDDLWDRYMADLSDLLKYMQTGQRQEARVELAKRAAEALQGIKTPSTPLYPIQIEIDNDTSPEYTVLRISATDTTGFLYELTNALAFHRIYIARMEIDTVGTNVHDTLYVTDQSGQKITTPQKQRELRAATVLIKHFTHLLPLSTDPESALLHFHEFIGELFRRPDWPDEFVSLERPEVLGALAQLLGVSDFLWDDFLRMQYANLFPVVRDVNTLESAKDHTQLQAELESALLPVHAGPQPLESGEKMAWSEVLNAFKDREMFRIDMRHILGLTKEFWEFSQELTDLAEVVVNAAYHLTVEDLRAQYGTPLLEDGTPAPMTVFALGKCGGRELGFASDIELMFVYAGKGTTSGPTQITTGEFYEKVVENFVRSIHARREGIFEVDLQLRPYGKAGSLAVSLESFRRYFNPDGPAWAYERQALVRLRPIAGDEALGAQVTALRDAYVYGPGTFDVTAMRAMRERQIRHLVKAGTYNPKYSLGGLVDVEYLVQGLQIRNGANNPKMRSPNTREAMAALAEAGILTPDDYTRLRKAYTFLRWLIDSLRMVDGNAKDLVVPPTNTEAFAYLARRLRYGSDRTRLHEDLLAYTGYVQEVNRRLL